MTTWDSGQDAYPKAVTVRASESREVLGLGICVGVALVEGMGMVVRMVVNGPYSVIAMVTRMNSAARRAQRKAKE